MKKIIIAIMAAVVSTASTFALDLTEAWQAISSNPKNISAPAKTTQATGAGVEQFTVCLNSAATQADIKELQNIVSQIPANQQAANFTSEDGINVRIFLSPANANGTLMNLLITMTKDGGKEDETLIALYGKATPEGLNNLIQHLSIEELIGG